MNIIIRYPTTQRCVTCRRYICLEHHENELIEAERQRRMDEEFAAGFMLTDDSTTQDTDI